jgi:hypothetical protein
MRNGIAGVLSLLITGTAASNFEVKDVQSTHGQFGPARKNEAYLPGDELYYGFTVAGAKLDKTSQINVEMSWKVTGPDGKEVAKDAIVLRAQLVLGGDSFPAKFSLPMSRDMVPGEYTVALELTDREARESASFERKFTLKPMEFGLVLVRTYHDPDGRAPAPGHKVAGETLFVRAAVVGFDHGKDEIDVDAEMILCSPDGKRISIQPIRVLFHEENAEKVKAATALNAKYQISLNRPGEFVVKIVCTDKHTKKTVEHEFPVRVTDR